MNQSYYSQAIGHYPPCPARPAPSYSNRTGSAYLTQFGSDPQLPPPQVTPTFVPPEPLVPQALVIAWQLSSLVGAAAGVYHGYKRNGDVGSALLWGFFGSIVPLITLPLSVAQGFGKHK